MVKNMIKHQKKTNRLKKTSGKRKLMENCKCINKARGKESSHNKFGNQDDTAVNDEVDDSSSNSSANSSSSSSSSLDSNINSCDKLYC